MSLTGSLQSFLQRVAAHFVLALLLCRCSESAQTTRPEVEPEQIQQAATVQQNFTDQWIASLTNATAMNVAPDGRVFVCLQAGQLRIVKNGALLATPFLSVTTDGRGERGLLGVTFDPNFASNQYVYVYYTATSPAAHNRVSRFRASGDVAVSGSETVIFDLPNLSGATNHNGGAIHFGPDGKLYVATGDNANSANAQSLSTTLGKILRINADGTIPTDNPFYGSTTGNNRAIWAYGLRNPFTFQFQPGTGRMFINDVGEASWEEINDGIAGSNYGWPTTEGYTTDSRFRSPLFAYGHGNGATVGCSITGGAFYNPQGQLFPSSFVGKYFFADYCSSWIRVFDPATRTASDFAGGAGAVDLKVSSDGYLYYLGRSGLGRIGYSGGGQAPSITAQPTNRTVAVGQATTFTVGATGTQPLSYRWQRGTTDIAGATSQSYSITPTAGDNGATFRVIVTNSYGTVTSSSATLTVSANRAPTAAITTPAANAPYAAGDTINYVGTGTDPEDGTLPASAFSWLIELYHDAHTHPFLGPITKTRSGSFVVPRIGHTETNVWYRIRLTVTDSSGLTNTTFADIKPRLSTLSFQTSPAGLQVTLEGQPVTTPTSVSSVVGVTRTLGVVSPQTLNGVTYQFASWSDNGASTHSVDTPASNTTYTAVFTPSSAPSGGLRAEYYDNIDFTALALTRTDSTVNFDWGNGSPDAAIDPEWFSVRWTGTVKPLYSQAYTFYTWSDDGVRLWVNGVQLVNNWTDHGGTEDSGTTTVLTAGQTYPIVLEFYERGGGATAKLSWSSASQTKQIVPSSQLSPGGAPPANAGLKAEYFSGASFNNLVKTRTDSTVSFDWGEGSPDGAVPADNFSVRWTGTVTPTTSQSYRFYTTSDDGIRLWIDGNQVINNWTDHGRTEDVSAPIALNAGQAYSVRLEFYERGGQANVSLAWESSALSKQIIPSSALRAAP